MGFIVWVNSETWIEIDNRVLFDFDGAIKLNSIGSVKHRDLKFAM